MTKKIFWIDPYMGHLETRIAAVAGPEVTLAEKGKERVEISLIEPAERAPSPSSG